MNTPVTDGSSTQLVFCSTDVKPEVITDLLGLTPSHSVSVGDTVEYENGHRRSSHLGIWKLDLPNANSEHTVEEQLAQWIDLLRPRSSALSQLKELGYRPYLDCKAGVGSLSLCIEPLLLMQLGELNVCLSVWLYEQ
jgi:FMN phosphatase YigB (HAD superfamily)